VDGHEYVERHIDGGTTSSMFFAPPWVPHGEREKLRPVGCTALIFTSWWPERCTRTRPR